MASEIPPLLRISPKTVVLPIIHGSGQCALMVRRWMLEHHFDCIAVPLPESFREGVEEAVLQLPSPAIVIQPRNRSSSCEGADYWSQESNDGGPLGAGEPFGEEHTGFGEPDFFLNELEGIDGDDEDTDADEEIDDDEDDDDWPLSYVPIDPCQGVIMGIRAALGEHIPRAYVDMECDPYLPMSATLPDAYALRTVSPERFAAAILPSLPVPVGDQTTARIQYTANRLRELESQYDSILFICSVLDWPWIRQAYREQTMAQAPFSTTENSRDAPSFEADEREQVEDINVIPPAVYRVKHRSLMFLFGELPFITGLYERARAELEDDENLSIDGVKELLIAARVSYRKEFGKRARPITPYSLSQCLKYIRNLSLVSRRMTPDLYTIVTGAKQIFGDQYALHVVEVARSYPYVDKNDDLDAVSLGIEQGCLPDGEIVSLVSRLPGPAVTWRSLELNRRPSEEQKREWSYQWNPYGQCSYPPEDVRIEQLRTRVFDRAKAVIGTDLAKTEKFTTSVKDGIDIRDTVRHWYEKQIYVKVIPPSRGGLDACVMLFDSPADPRDYPWRTTWFAEHLDESTLAFFATDFTKEIVGPGICMATYGGAMFLYPPVSIPDIWTDRRLDFVETLEERLLAAACLHSRQRQVALLSSLPPGAGWRRLAKRFRRQLVHVPTSSFSEAELSQLRLVHVLNGTHVRSYAEHFIRKA